MPSIDLDQKQLQILIMSVKHCMESCKEGGKASGCKDCESLEKILSLLEKAKSNP